MGDTPKSLSRNREAALSGTVAALDTTTKDGLDAMTTALDPDEDSKVTNIVKVVSGEDSHPRPGSEEHEIRLPLPPRPTGNLTRDQPPTALPTLGRPSTAKRPQLQARPTTAVSSIDIQTVGFPDGSRETYSSTSERNRSAGDSGLKVPSRNASRRGSDHDDSVSLLSYAPTLRAGDDLDSLLDDCLSAESPVWKALHTEAGNPSDPIDFESDLRLAGFEHEFDELEEVDSKGGNEGTLMKAILGILPADV